MFPVDATANSSSQQSLQHHTPTCPQSWKNFLLNNILLRAGGCGAGALPVFDENEVEQTPANSLMKSLNCSFLRISATRRQAAKRKRNIEELWGKIFFWTTLTRRPRGGKQDTVVEPETRAVMGGCNIRSVWKNFLMESYPGMRRIPGSSKNVVGLILPCVSFRGMLPGEIAILKKINDFEFRPDWRVLAAPSGR